MDTDSGNIYDNRIKELLPFKCKGYTVEKAIFNLLAEKYEESVVKKLENTVAKSILTNVKSDKPVTVQKYCQRLILDYLLFEGLVVCDTPSKFTLKGYGDETYVFHVEVISLRTSKGESVFVTLKRLEFRTETGTVIRRECKASHKIERFPTFDDNQSIRDENIIFQELKDLRSAFKKTWEHLNLPKTPTNSETA